MNDSPLLSPHIWTKWSMHDLISSKPASKWSLMTKILLVVPGVLLLLQVLSLGPSTFSIRNPGCENLLQDHTAIAAQSNPNQIPNIVHFVHLIRDDGEQILRFPFNQFIAIYSASHFLQPDIIYIHTNVDADKIPAAVANTTDSYVQIVSRLPNVKFNHYKPQKKTSRGGNIGSLAAKSDFARTDLLKKMGGIYLDDDAFILRDLKPFRQAGFEFVTAWQNLTTNPAFQAEWMCPAVILTTPGNPLITAYQALQDTVFDGQWATHAMALLTSLVLNFADRTAGVLILPRDTFFPLSWLEWDLEAIYGIHDDEGTEVINNHPTDNLTDFIENFQMNPPNTWQIDWRSSYVLHGWHNAIRDVWKGDAVKKKFGRDDFITLDYVLSRKSNFARAVYPAVAHAVTEGVLDEKLGKNAHAKKLQVLPKAELKPERSH